MSNEDNNAMSPDELYREENYTDQKTGAIRKLIPVLADGSDDPDRTTAFFGLCTGNDPYGRHSAQFCPRWRNHW